MKIPRIQKRARQWVYCADFVPVGCNCSQTPLAIVVVSIRVKTRFRTSLREFLTFREAIKRLRPGRS
jgi:hypothetical protein